MSDQVYRNFPDGLLSPNCKMFRCMGPSRTDDWEREWKFQFPLTKRRWNLDRVGLVVGYCVRVLPHPLSTFSHDQGAMSSQVTSRILSRDFTLRLNQLFYLPIALSYNFFNVVTLVKIFVKSCLSYESFFINTISTLKWGSLNLISFSLFYILVLRNC